MLFKLYENESFNDVEITGVHKIVECMSLSNQSAMILANWFYRREGNRLRLDFKEDCHFIAVRGDELLEVLGALDKVLGMDDGYERNFEALLFFPVVYDIPNSSVNMWSEGYYKHLEDVRGSLKSVVSSDSVSNRERLFYYNVRW